MTADILIVDDEADIRDLISDILTDNGYVTRTAKDSDSALKVISERVPSALILDIWLQGSELDGLGILELVRKKYPHMPVVMISGHGNIETAVAAIKIGATDFIEKPFKEDRLLLVIAKALEIAKLREENRELKSKSAHDLELNGQSTVIAQIRQVFDRVGPTQSRVLITGGQGTGKELCARIIHSKSPRANRNFVVFNPAGLTQDMIEVELFGREDATQAGNIDKLGAFERAHGGTLFIDELADISPESQSKLLRTLQENSFTRVNGTQKVGIDVRVIAASTRDLTEEIAKGNVREELYYRLNVVPVRIPLLCERRDDIPELCHFFLKRSAEAHGLAPRELSDDAIATLQAYQWPGNVRELRNMMEWLAIMAPRENIEKEGKVTSKQLPSDILYSNPLLTRPEVNADIMSLPLRDARELFEKQYLAAQIERFGGNISRTSNFIGMERSALHRKLKMLGLHGNDDKKDSGALEEDEPLEQAM